MLSRPYPKVSPYPGKTIDREIQRPVQSADLHLRAGLTVLKGLTTGRRRAPCIVAYIYTQSRESRIEPATPIMVKGTFPTSNFVALYQRCHTQMLWGIAGQSQQDTTLIFIRLPVGGCGCRPWCSFISLRICILEVERAST